jgi:response regulator of citrate/malate metabolism
MRPYPSWRTVDIDDTCSTLKMSRTTLYRYVTLLVAACWIELEIEYMEYAVTQPG